MKKIISCLLLMFIAVSLFSCASKEKEEIHVFYTSDVHCGIEDNVAAAGLKAMVDEAKQEYKNVLLIDSGDYLQGGSFGSLSRGQSIIELMNLLNYDVATFGNHEFDYGMSQLKSLMNQANFDFVASNVLYNGSKESVFEGVPEYIIKDFNGTKIGFIGVITPETLVSSTPAFFMENNQYVYDFYGDKSGDKLANQVQKVVDELRDQKVDYIVALTHLGSTNIYAPLDSITLISKTKGIDVVIDGHSHSVVYGDLYPNLEGEDVLLSSVGTKLENVGHLIIEKDGTISNVLISEYDKQDENVLKYVEDVKKNNEDILSEHICDVDFDLSIVDENGIRLVRSRETNIGDFVCDAFRIVLDSDIGVSNGGGIRSNIPQGKVTYKSLYNVAPFDNKAVKIRATGKQIVDYLEFGSHLTESTYRYEDNAYGEFGGFIQVSGLKYTINTGIESTVEFDESGMLKTLGENRRVEDVQVLVDGEYQPIDLDKYYTIASSDYVLLSSGDGNTIFNDCELVLDSGKLLPEVFKDYIALNGSILDIYKEIDNRITIK